MATDPTKSVQERELDSPLETDLEGVVQRLAAMEPSTDVPIATVTLDWRIEGTNPGRQPDDQHPDRTPDRKRSSSTREEERGEESARRRPARRVFEDRMGEIVEAHGPHDEAHESLKVDFDRISAYLAGEIDPSAQGVYIVSCSARDIFEAVPLGLPLPTDVKTAPAPALAELVRLKEDASAYAVLLADQQDATLSFIALGATEGAVTLEGSEYPRKQAQGGWSQRRYQARADERVEAFARDVAEETRKALDEHGVDVLIVAGNEVITSALDPEFHQTVKDRIVATMPLDIDTSPSDLIAATQPVAIKAERAREGDAVRRMSEGIGAGTYGAGGASDVLTALQAGQVETLIMNDDYEGNGWADYSMPAFGVGDLPTSHPLGGDSSDLVAVDLREELIRLAVQTGAEVEIVHTDVPDDTEDVDSVPQGGGELPRSVAAVTLDEHGGVGAVLRYVIGDEPSEEESAAQAQDRDRS